MEINHDIHAIISAYKAEKEAILSNAKFDETVKQDKQVVDLPSYISTRYTEGFRSEVLTKSPIEKLKLRQFVFSRPDYQPLIELKSPHTKRSLENHLFYNSKIPLLPLLSIRTNAFEETYKEIKDLKLNINEQEEKNKVNLQCIEMNKLKISSLQEKHLKLLRKTGVGCSYEERKEQKSNTLKSLQGNWKKNTEKLKESIKVLEEEEKELLAKMDSIRSQLLCRQQQQRGFKRNLNTSLDTKNGHHSCDLLSKSGQLKVLTKTPSWDLLYQGQ